MVRYRRSRIPGGTYFFTVTLRDRKSALLTENVGLLRAAFRQVHRRRPYTLDAAVILPDHLHVVMVLPGGDHDYSGRWRAIKSLFVRYLRRAGVPTYPAAGGGYGVWQARFWEHLIRDENDWRRHVDYTHWNPVKHGLVERVVDWPYSSFGRYVRAGVLPVDWGGGPMADDDGAFGE
jgi:putative transposase